MKFSYQHCKRIMFSHVSYMLNSRPYSRQYQLWDLLHNALNVLLVLLTYVEIFSSTLCFEISQTFIPSSGWEEFRIIPKQRVHLKHIMSILSYPTYLPPNVLQLTSPDRKENVCSLRTSYCYVTLYLSRKLHIFKKNLLSHKLLASLSSALMILRFKNMHDH